MRAFCKGSTQQTRGMCRKYREESRSRIARRPLGWTIWLDLMVCHAAWWSGLGYTPMRASFRPARSRRGCVARALELTERPSPRSEPDGLEQFPVVGPRIGIERRLRPVLQAEKRVLEPGERCEDRQETLEVRRTGVVDALLVGRADRSALRVEQRRTQARRQFRRH